MRFEIPEDQDMKLAVRLPVGQHKCEVEAVLDNGKSEKGNQKIQVKLVCTDGEHDGKVAFDNIAMVPQCFFKLLPYGIAAGVVDEDGSGSWAPGADVDLDDILGAKVLATLDEEEAINGKTYVNVTRVEPLS